MSDSIVFLLSTAGGSLSQNKHQSLFDDWISGKHLKVEKYDGAFEGHEEMRDKLFEISGDNTYPQLFIKDGEGNIKFIGGYAKIEKLIEDKTFDETFASVAKVEHQEGSEYECDSNNNNSNEAAAEIAFKVLIDTLNTNPEEATKKMEESDFKLVFDQIVGLKNEELVKAAIDTGFFNNHAIDSENFEYVKAIKNETLTNNQRKALNEKYGEEHKEELESLFPPIITKIVIVKGVDLRICDKDSSDPYATVLDSNYKKLFKTKTIKKSVNPEWNETFEIDYYKESLIHIRVEDKDVFVDDIEGITHLDVGNNVYEVNKDYEIVLRVAPEDLEADKKKFGDDYHPKNAIVIRFE